MTDDHEEATDREGLFAAFYQEQNGESGCQFSTTDDVLLSYEDDFSIVYVAPGEAATFCIIYQCTTDGDLTTDAGADFHIYTNDPDTAAVVYISVNVTY